MLAVHLDNGAVTIREIPVPERPPGSALLRLLTAGICNTDLELQRGYYGFAGIPGHEFVAPWMSIAETARVHVMKSVPPEQRQQACEWEAIKVSLANLMTFPWIAERVRAGSLALHGTWFNIHTGELMILQADDRFAAA